MSGQFSRRGYPEWQQQLIDKYPLIYLEHDAGIPYSELEPCNLRFGFEFSSGWVELVNEFSQVATGLVVFLRQSTTQENAYIHARIFKEKFGTLEWQGCNNLTEPFSSLFDGYTQYIEDRSSLICEECGERGALYKKKEWLMVRCEKHIDGRLKRLKELTPIEIHGSQGEKRTML